MTYTHIVEAVRRLQHAYEENDPLTLCRYMGIQILYSDLGTGADAIKGFFLERFRIPMIVLNANLPLPLRRIIAAHELGHAVLHREQAVHTFSEVQLFDESSQYEKEANLFAAELLLDDAEVLESLNADSTFFSVASQLNVPVELLDFKFRVMKWKGYKLVEPPLTAQSTFLKDLDVPRDTEGLDI